MVGLGIVDNTADASKPISTATKDALDLKAHLATPICTGTVAGISKSMVGLGNVDNTADASKPISTATHKFLNALSDKSNTYTKGDVGTHISNLIAAAPRGFEHAERTRCSVAKRYKLCGNRKTNSHQRLR